MKATGVGRFFPGLHSQVLKGPTQVVSRKSRRVKVCTDVSCKKWDMYTCAVFTLPQFLNWGHYFVGIKLSFAGSLTSLQDFFKLADWVSQPL